MVNLTVPISGNVETAKGTVDVNANWEGLIRCLSTWEFKCITPHSATGLSGKAVPSFKKGTKKTGQVTMTLQW